jgi:hypothetical protein
VKKVPDPLGLLKSSLVIVPRITFLKSNGDERLTRNSTVSAMPMMPKVCASRQKHFTPPPATGFLPGMTMREDETVV